MVFAKNAKRAVTVQKLKSWSYSRYSDWAQCPRKAKFKHIDRIKEPENDAMRRGSMVHSMAESYITGKAPSPEYAEWTKKLAPELKLFADEFKTLRTLYKRKSLPMVVEDNWGFTNSWEPTAWDDWVNCWVRIKLDCAHYRDETVLVVTDWKTGKPNADKNSEYMEQLELYALTAMLMHEEIEAVYPRLGYTDVGQFYPPPDQEVVYTRADLPKLKAAWNKRTKNMMNDEMFPPRPNSKCVWCFYGQSGLKKGGPGLCEY